MRAEGVSEEAEPRSRRTENYGLFIDFKFNHKQIHLIYKYKIKWMNSLFCALFTHLQIVIPWQIIQFKIENCAVESAGGGGVWRGWIAQ